MNIIEQRENNLLNRTEVKAIIEAEKNPNVSEAVKIIADEFKAAEELIAIKEIKGKFGRGTFLLAAHIYNKKEDKEQLEKKKEKKAAGK